MHDSWLEYLVGRELAIGTSNSADHPGRSRVSEFDIYAAWRQINNNHNNVHDFAVFISKLGNISYRILILQKTTHNIILMIMHYTSSPGPESFGWWSSQQCPGAPCYSQSLETWMTKKDFH